METATTLSSVESTIIFPVIWWSILDFELTVPPFNNRHLRLAIAHAIDKEQLVKVMDDGKRPTDVLLANKIGQELANAQGRQFNLAKAREYLAKSGWDIKKPIHLSAFFSFSKHKLQVTNIQHQLKVNLGLKVEIDVVEYRELLEKLQRNRVSFFRYFTDHLNTSVIGRLIDFTSHSERNLTGWKSQEFDQLVDQISRRPGHETGHLVKKALMLLMDDAPVIPLYFSARDYLISSRVKGFEHCPYFHSQYQYVWLDNDSPIKR